MSKPHNPIDALPNPKWEIFARQVAKGKEPSSAWVAAGYQSSFARQGAEKLLTRVEIQDRIHMLRGHPSKCTVKPEITNRAARIEALQDRWERMKHLILARQAGGQAQLRYAEYEYGLVKSQKESLEALVAAGRDLDPKELKAAEEAQTEAFRRIEFARELETGLLAGPDHKGQFKFDAALMTEMSALEKQVAMETGQWVERRDIRIPRKLEDLTDEEFNTLLGNAEEQFKLRQENVPQIPAPNPPESVQ